MVGNGGRQMEGDRWWETDGGRQMVGDRWWEMELKTITCLIDNHIGVVA